jgi:hypothetical protein
MKQALQLLIKDITINIIIETNVTIIDKKQNITINVIFETRVTAMDNKYNN